MSLPTLPIRDRIFSHAFSSSGWLKPTYFVWDYKNLDKPFVFLTDWEVFEHGKYDGLKKYAWLVESPVITPTSHQFVLDNWKCFDAIFTHSKKLLSCPNARCLPIGGSFLKETEFRTDYDKTKLVSMIFSQKIATQGQQLRHQIAAAFDEIVDLMGSGVGFRLENKIESCRDYMYSIAVENCQEDFYFTEKILDCFLTGTIPIYWGCPSIDSYFDKDGIIIFNTLEELYHILENQNLLYERYLQSKDVIQKNFELALTYKIAEDRLWLHNQNILTNLQ